MFISEKLVKVGPVLEAETNEDHHPNLIIIAVLKIYTFKEEESHNMLLKEKIILNKLLINLNLMIYKKII